MKLSDRIKTYNFWVSLSSAIFLIIKVLGNQIGFNVDESLFSDLITSICSILVILGIIVPPKNAEIKSRAKLETTDNEIVSENAIYGNPSTLDDLPESLDNKELQDVVLNDEIKSNIQNETDNNLALQNNESSIIDGTEIQSTEPEIIDVDLESANFNLENIDNINTLNILSQKESFEMELKHQKKLFENNIDEYIKILETQLNELKSK